MLKTVKSVHILPNSDQIGPSLRDDDCELQYHLHNISNLLYYGLYFNDMRANAAGAKAGNRRSPMPAAPSHRAIPLFAFCYRTNRISNRNWKKLKIAVKPSFSNRSCFLIAVRTGVLAVALNRGKAS
jgi:hypothetical protein